VHEEKDDDGNVTSQVKGMSKIFDPVLLEEMIQYNEDGNFDRIIAAELAIALAMKLDPIFGRIGDNSDSIKKGLGAKREKRIMFTDSQGMFGKVKRKLFT
jgi:hypothetical protein